MDERVKRYMDLTGLSEIPAKLTQDIVKQFKGAFGIDGLDDDMELPDDFKNAFVLIEKTLTDNQPELYEQFAGVYKKYLTDEEIDRLISFQESPEGRKLVTVGMNIQDDIVTFGNEWGVKMFKSLQTEVAKLLNLEQPSPQPAP